MQLEEWKQRYKQAFMDRANLTDAEAQMCLDAAEFPDVLDGYEDDPEGSALEEMSCWDS
jgi:hypothetical protein